MRKQLLALLAVSTANFLTPSEASAASTFEFTFSELLYEERRLVDELAVEVAVTRNADGLVLGEANGVDTVSGDEVDVWTDGTTLWWSGLISLSTS